MNGTGKRPEQRLEICRLPKYIEPMPSINLKGSRMSSGIVKIMPCLDMRAGRVVKGVHFVDIADAGDPVTCAQAYCKAGADELALLDITATPGSRA